MSAPGTLCWVDLGTSDPAAAARFYSGLLGWEVGEPDGAGYRFCTQNGQLVGALTDDPQPDPWWTTNVSVAEIEDAARAVVRAGGEIYAGPATLGEQGRFASARDPTGTKILLWEPLASAGVELRGVVGSWVSTTLFAPNWGALRGFYEAAFSWRSAGSRPGGAVDLITRDGLAVATYEPIPQGWPSEREALWVPFFGVDDLDGALERAGALGARRSSRLESRPDAALVVDDQGVVFGLEAL